MLLEAKAAEPVNPLKLASYDARSVPISFQVDAHDSRFFPDFTQWKQEPVEVSVGARTLNVRADVFKHATHVPLNEQLLTVAGVASGRSSSERPVFTATSKPAEAPASNVLLSLFAIPLGLGALGGAVGFATHPGERWRYAGKGAFGGFGAGVVIDTAACGGTPSTAPAEVTQVPAEVTQSAPATTAVEAVTNTPPPGFQTETPAAPSDILGSHPDYADASVGGIAFTHGATAEQLADVKNPLGLPEYAISAYAENIKAIKGKVDGEQSAQVFWNSTFDRNFVLLTRVNSGVTQVAVIAAGDGNFSYHPNAEWFDFAATETPAYTWVALPAGVAAVDLVGGYFGDYPVWGIQKASETVPSQLFVPGAENGFENNPAAPVEVAKFSIDALGLTPDVAAALKKHSGLEASIVAEADGFTTQITYWDAEHNLVTEKVNIDPSGLTENVQSKNELGNTPVMLTTEGQKLYWSQEHKGWFKIEMNPDINNPTFVPQEYTDVVVRALIAEYSEPFSQAAIDWWKKASDLVLELNFQYLEVNANTHTGTIFGYLRNTAMGDDARTIANSPVQFIDAWFTTQMPDGTSYQYFPTKWLDPTNPKNPQGGDWKIILTASGQEIMGDEGNRTQYDKLWAQASDPKSGLEVLPIFKAQEGFFNGTNGMITLSVPQPSLAKLATQADIEVGNLHLPNRPADTFRMWIDNAFSLTNASAPWFEFKFPSKNDEGYKTNFFPSEFQTIIFPSMITLR